MQRSRTVWLVLGAIIVGCALALGAACGEDSDDSVSRSDAPKPTLPPRSESTTQVIRYAPPMPEPVEDVGECFADSLTTGRRDAARCSLVNQIHDPCFLAQDTLVVCPGDPRTETDDVAFRDANQRGPALDRDITAWFVVLDSGQGCSRFSNPGMLPRTASSESVFGCPNGLLCSEPAPSTSVWTVECFDPSRSSPVETHRLREAWE